MRKWALIVAAGGSGTRFGAHNKLLVELQGRPVLLHALAELGPGAAAVIVVAPVELWPTYQALTRTLDFPVCFAPGGAVRSESVGNGLRLVPDDIELVAIHDAARPLTSRRVLTAVLERAAAVGGAIPAHRVTDTIKRVDADGLIVETVAREALAAVETPQTFAVARLREAFAVARRANLEFTDEAGVMEYAGFPVAVVFHNEPNPKVTYAEDLVWIQAMAETLTR